MQCDTMDVEGMYSGSSKDLQTQLDGVEPQSSPCQIQGEVTTELSPLGRWGEGGGAVGEVTVRVTCQTAPARWGTAVGKWRTPVLFHIAVVGRAAV